MDAYGERAHIFSSSEMEGLRGWDGGRLPGGGRHGMQGLQEWEMEMGGHLGAWGGCAVQWWRAKSQDPNLGLAGGGAVCESHRAL